MIYEYYFFVFTNDLTVVKSEITKSDSLFISQRWSIRNCLRSFPIILNIMQKAELDFAVGPWFT